MMEKREDEYLSNDPGKAEYEDETDKLNGINSDEMSESNKEEKSKSSIFGKKNTSREGKLKEEIAQLEDDHRELGDRFLRLFSEFDNYKKRTSKEKIELIETASAKVISELLPIVDDFERAIKANEHVDDLRTIKEGFLLIYHKLIKLLEQNGVEEIGEIGDGFDTDIHEAIAHIETTDENKGKVIDVTQKGYRIKDKVIRYAKVVVGN